MARLTSAAAAKGKATSPVQNAPRPGTGARRVYDWLFARPGTWQRLPPPDDLGIRSTIGLNIIRAYMQDFYGLDIRQRDVGVKGARGKGRGSEWMLAGEWFGNAYVDYVANPELARPSA